MNYPPFIALLRKELTLELRRKSIIAGLVLYLVSTVFLSYLSFRIRQNDLSPAVWSALYWITILFTAVSAVGKSFIGERKGRDIYYYSIASPSSIIMSKMVYNFILCLTMALGGFGLFVLFLGNPIQDMFIFLAVVKLASLGFAASLTLVSGIASRTNSSHIIMAVLSFPVVISILLVCIKVTKNCIDGLDRSVSWNDLMILLSINCIVTAVSYLLFPYIWRS